VCSRFAIWWLGGALVAFLCFGNNRE
jgi:hypothetical protein